MRSHEKRQSTGKALPFRKIREQAERSEDVSIRLYYWQKILWFFAMSLLAKCKMWYNVNGKLNNFSVNIPLGLLRRSGKRMRAIKGRVTRTDGSKCVRAHRKNKLLTINRQFVLLRFGPRLLVKNAIKRHISPKSQRASRKVKSFEKF